MEQTWAWVATDLICESSRMFTAQNTIWRITLRTRQELWCLQRSEWSNIRSMTNCQHHLKVMLISPIQVIFNSPILSTRTFIAAKSVRNQIKTNLRALWTRQVEFTGLMEVQSEQISRNALFKVEMQENVVKIENQTSNPKPITSFHQATSANFYWKKDRTEASTHLKTNIATKLILRT